MRALITALLFAAALPASAADAWGGSWGTSWGTSWGAASSPLVNVPDCSGNDQATCESSVSGAGLVPNAIAQCSGSVTSGNVISTQPPAGTSVESGSTVNIFVSNGMACSGRRPLGNWLILDLSED